MDNIPDVTPISGEITRYHVASDSGKPPYLVDLAPYDGSGACGCQQFTMRLEPKLAAGERDWTETQALACKHIRRARLYFAIEMVRTLDQNK